MIDIPFVDTDDDFPPVARALGDPNGLLCWGGQLTAERLYRAYCVGIFPWYSPGQPVLWWSPDPRMVLAVDDFKLQRSLAKVIRNGGFDVRVDTAFESVMRHCAAAPRDGQHGTWITDDIIAAYTALHRAGFAHSFETWREGELVGGLYGVSIGGMYFGESMFAKARDASKVALAQLVAQLKDWNMPWIDCQQETAHLASLGAKPIARAAFVRTLAGLIEQPTRKGVWQITGSPLG